MPRMAKESVTKATILMGWPQRVQTSGSTWYTFESRRAQLGEQPRFWGPHPRPRAVDFCRWPLAAHPVGVVGIAVGPVIARVRDVVRARDLRLAQTVVLPQHLKACHSHVVSFAHVSFLREVFKQL